MDSTMMSVFGVGVSMAAILVVGLRSLRAEVTAVETRLGKRIDDSKSELAAVETRLRGDMNAVETRLGKRIDDTKTELRTEINAVETRLGKRIDGLDSRVNRLDRRLTLLEGALSAVLRPLRRPGLPDPTPDESPA